MRWYLLVSEVLSRIFQRKIFVVLPWTQLTPICVFSYCSSMACCNDSNTPTFRIVPVTFYLCFPRGTGAWKRVSYLYWRMLALIIVSYVSVKFVSLENWISSLFPTCPLVRVFFVVEVPSWSPRCDLKSFFRRFSFNCYQLHLFAIRLS